MKKTGYFSGKTNWTDDWDHVTNKKVYDWEPQTIVAKKRYDTVERHRRLNCNIKELEDFCAALCVPQPHAPKGSKYKMYRDFKGKQYDISDDAQFMRLILDIHESVYPVAITRTFTATEYAQYLKERKMKNEQGTNVGND